MDTQKNNRNDTERLFGAVSKNGAIIIAASKREVKEKVAKRGIAKPNFALFKCQIIGGGDKKNIKIKGINRVRFKLSNDHRKALISAFSLHFSQSGAY